MLIKVFDRWINPEKIITIENETSDGEPTGAVIAYTTMDSYGETAGGVRFYGPSTDELAQEIISKTAPQQLPTEPQQPYEMPVAHMINPRLLAIARALVINKDELKPTEHFKAAYDRLIDLALDTMKQAGGSNG